MIFFLLQATQIVDMGQTPNVWYDIIKQSLTAGTIVALLWMILRGRQKAIDDKAVLLASSLTEFKAQVEKDNAKFETDLKDLEGRMREFEKNYLARFEEVNHNIAQLTTEVRVALSQLKQLKQG